MKITDDMVERAARAACEAEGIPADARLWRTGEKFPASFSGKPVLPPAWKRYVPLARAALEAALNPPRINPRDGEHG